MSAAKENKSETYSDEETAKRRDEVVRRMLHTPPKHKTAPKPKRKLKKK